MRQPSLFDDQPLSRNRDPQTSHAAADRIKKTVNKLQEKVLFVFTRGIELTAQEAAKRCQEQYCTDPAFTANHDTCRKRIHELVGKEKLRIVGKRYCTVTHCMAQAYERIF